MSPDAGKQLYIEHARKVAEESLVPGAAVGLTKEGLLTFTHGFGFRDLEKQFMMTPDTVCGIGSITKSLTCAAIMQLQEAGKLSVHDPVIKYIPEFRLKDGKHVGKMTIHHFMTHSAGLPPLPSLIPAMKNSLNQDPHAAETVYGQLKQSVDHEIHSYQQLIDYIANLDFELLGAPGEQFSYSNDCFALLGLIIERIAGVVYEDYVTQHLLIPAGMNNSFFSLDKLTKQNNVAMLFGMRVKDGNKEVYPSPIWWDAPSMRAAGFMKSTVKDMLKYADIYRTGGLVGKQRILSEVSVKMMLTPYIPCEYGQYYGYGLMITPNYHGTTLVEHGGSIKGAQAHLSIIPERGLTGVALTNMQGAPAAALLSSAFNIFEGRNVHASHMNLPNMQLDADQLSEYAGKYGSSEGTEIQIQLMENKLMLFMESQCCPIQVVEKDLFSFSMRGMNLTLHFIRNDRNLISRVTFGYRQITKLL
ncbi:serine hydrolase domain-containing protein [Paenibacillus aestuarii]|uniref:Serine hydrolase domain-containing protein n=1 Tax=Paenibacillus aestuarii TaxID=516965 RepID=A0ABW0K9J1_9BACL|nr:serine hydrolase [Paenibacillus aestuarii]